MNNVLFALLLTLAAGLSTGLGGLVILFTRAADKKFLSICLSFSAGIMLYVSFAEIFLKAFESLQYAFDDEIGYLVLTISFFTGIAIMVIIDKFIPDDEAHTEPLETSTPSTPSTQAESADYKENRELKRTGISSALAIAIHNFPEGLITFMAALYDPGMGIVIAIAITIHNIPEGIAIAAPIYYATGSKMKAFLVAVGAGLTEPLGALIAWLLFRNMLNEMDAAFGIIFAAVSGIMLFVAIHQLLPTAQKYGKHHLVMKWMFIGMLVMAVSLVLMNLFF